MTVSLSHYFIPLYELVVKISVLSDSFDFKKQNHPKILSAVEFGKCYVNFCYQKHCFSNVAAKNGFHTTYTQSFSLNTIFV